MTSRIPPLFPTAGSGRCSRTARELSGPGREAGGLSRFHPETESFTRFQNTPEDPTSLSNDTVRVIYEDSQRNLWIGTARRAQPLRPSYRRTFDRFHHNPSDPNSLTHDFVLAIHEDRNGTLWIGTENGGLDELNPSVGSSFVHHRSRSGRRRDDFPRPRECRSWKDREGLLWIASYGDGGGLNRLNTALPMQIQAVPT